MTRSLPSPWELIAAAWKGYLQHWNEIMKISMRFVYIGIAEFLIEISATFLPDQDIYQVILAILSIGIALLFFQTTIRLIQSILRIDEGKKIELGIEAETKAWKKFLPLVWVGFLQGLIIMGASLPLIIWRVGMTLSGAWSPIAILITALLTSPTIYVILLLSFSSMSLIEADLHGMQAIASSRLLVASRWMQVFLREACGALLFIGSVYFLTSVLLLILSIAIGQERILAIALLETPDPLIDGATILINTVMQAVGLPLILLFQVKLYRALRK